MFYTVILLLSAIGYKILNKWRIKMAYNPISISSVATNIPFTKATPNKYIWVSPNGNNNNAGSSSAPMETIQAAVDKATPGTAVMVKTGTYTENIQLKVDGTATKPIWLTSADGIGKAKIIAADNNQSVIAGYGEDNWVVKGFATEGGKNGIQFSQSGSGLTNLSHNVVIQENVIRNVSLADGIKLSQADHHAMIGNHIEGGVGEEGIDNVYTTNSVIAYNTIMNTNGLSAITMKGGSANINVHHNYIEGAKTDGILIGGYMGTGSGGSIMPNGLDYQAKNITVEFNEIHEVGKRAVNALGGHDSTVKTNWLDPQNSYYTVVGVYKDNMNHISSNIKFLNNIVSKDAWLVVAPGEGTGISQSGNTKTGTWTYKTGADDMPASSVSAPVGASGAQAIWEQSQAPTKMIKGGAGADTLTGTAGHDHLDGASGHDTMTGGRGDDTYTAGSRFDKAIEKSGEGIDTIHLYDTEFKMLNFVENLVIKTSAGADVWDTAGKNLYTAGSGDDSFHFGTNSGRDGIKGFTVGHDTIFLDPAIPVEQVAGYVENGNFVLDLPGNNSVTLMGVRDLPNMD
jgi:Ca2+-binding RTX toxin-like protein